MRLATSLRKPTRYSGYRSFQYLDPGTDYEAVELAPQVGRVPSTPVPVTAEQEERVQRLLVDCVVISLNDRTTVATANPSEVHRAERAGRYSTAYEGLSHSGLDAVFDVPGSGGWKWDDAIRSLGMRLADMAHQDYVVPARTVSDILAAKRNGQLAYVLTLEAATIIDNEIDRLDVLHGLGLRLSGISYSMSNALGAGGREVRDGGLTAFGRRAVRRMNQLGIAIDVSHASDQTSLDAIAASEKPVFIAHAGARALWNAPRMKPDSVIRACAERGGVMGIQAGALSTMTAAHRTQTIESVMEHFEYTANLVGLDHVAFGPDTSFGDQIGQLRTTHPHLFNDPAAQGGLSIDPFDYVDGIENPGEFPNIVRWLVAHGYADEDIGKVLGGNILRVLGQVWA